MISFKDSYEDFSLFTVILRRKFIYTDKMYNLFLREYIDIIIYLRK